MSSAVCQNVFKGQQKKDAKIRRLFYFIHSETTYHEGEVLELILQLVHVLWVEIHSPPNIGNSLLSKNNVKISVLIQ